MAQRREALPAQVAQVHGRIQRWRETRQQQTGPMPEELWREAGALAAAHGVYRIAQALGVRYESLRRRVELSSKRKGQASEGLGGFVELRMAAPAGSEPRRALVELSSCDGARMVVQLVGYEDLDVKELAESFFKRLP